MSYLPDTYKHFERTFPTVHAAHQELARRCYEGGPLDERSARLVKLGIAIGAQAEGAVRSLARRALAEQMPPEELRHVGLLALTTIGSPTRARLDRGGDRKHILTSQSAARQRRASNSSPELV